MATLLTVGAAAPNFTLPATSNEFITLDSLKSKTVVLYFYPKDCTPGCTLEGRDFRDNIAKFQKRNAVIFGISRDTIDLHEKFKSDEQFPFELLSDTNADTCKRYGVLKEKSMFGKKVQGIERSTFLIDDHGVIRHIWRNVKVAGHVDAILKAIDA